jgi:DNA-binding NtrC family response regulator
MTETGKDAPRARVLVVEDSSVFREMQGLLLGQAGYAVSSHESPQSALEVAARQHFDLVVIDYELPEMNGQQFMHALRKIQPDIAVVFVSGALTLELAIQLSSQGVAGIFNKPANPKNLLEKINETLARNAARDTAARVGSGSPVAAPRRNTSRPPFTATGGTDPGADRLAYVPRYFLGSSDRFRELTHRLWKVRDFRSVLRLHGEAGGPFELLARELVEISIFREGPVMVCPASRFDPNGLIEVLAPSLLSHDAGTLIVSGVEGFTGAQQETLEDLISGRGVFLPFARRFRLVLAATNALSDRVDDGGFGETLFYKVSALSLAVPSLREMRSDIPANARRILALHREQSSTTGPLGIAADAAEWLESRDWPGNYDELVQTVLRAAARAAGDELTVPDLLAAADGGSVRVVPPVPVRATAADDTARATVNARPPFPIASDLARPAATSETRPAPAEKSPDVSAARAVARAPAGRLFARPVAAAPAAAEPKKQSLFRPASTSYSFGKRLTDSLAAADAD